MTEPDRQTKLCRNCYEPIDVRARVCPHCRRETWTDAKHGMKMRYALAILLATFIVFGHPLGDALRDPRLPGAGPPHAAVNKVGKIPWIADDMDCGTF